MKVIDQNLGGTTPFDVLIDFDKDEVSEPVIPSGGAKKNNNIFNEFDEFDSAANKDKYWFTSRRMARIMKINDYLDSLPEGNRRKVITREREIPALIIHPNVITGRISPRSSEPNPAMVVSAAYRQGFPMKRTVSRTSSPCPASGFLELSSRYRTIKWMVMAIVMIICKDIK